MRPALRLILVLLSALGCGPDAATPPPKPRNLILISLDTLRADHLGQNGYERRTSPRLDAFAARGAVFRNAISAAAWTVPAHMSLFTGLEPPAHGLLAFPNPGRLADSTRTLAEILRSAGFRTAAFTGGGFLSTRHGFEAGFEVYSAKGRRLPPKLPQAKAWLESLAPGERSFLFLHGFDIHRPYRPPGEFATAFVPPAAADAREAASPLVEDLAVLVREARPGVPVTARPSDSELAWLIAQYDGEIGFADELLGNFFDWLETSGRLADTLVVVVSDHGEEFYEHGAVDHVRTLYDELLRVVWFMVGPGVPATVEARPVALIDVLPTVLDVLEIPVPATTQGRSRLPLLRGGSDAAHGDPDDPVFSFIGFVAFPYSAASVRTATWKLIRWSRAGTAEKLATPNRPREWYTHLFVSELDDRVELFDLRRDPGEQEDVSARHPAVVARLARALDDRIAASVAIHQAPGAARPPNAAEIEALRSLGYME